MVEPHQMQDGGLQIVDMDFVFDGCETEFIEQTWLTNRAISEKTAEGFTFADAAPESAAIDWMLVR